MARSAILVALALGGASAFSGVQTHGRPLTRVSKVQRNMIDSSVINDVSLAVADVPFNEFVAPLVAFAAGVAVAGAGAGISDTPAETVAKEPGAPITEDEVLACQAGWVNAIQDISKAYLDGGDFVGAAGEAAGALYGYGHHDVLFKPTKATKNPFRPTGESAMSYFVGAKNFAGSEKYEGEDGGFAINGGQGWKKVVFNNHKIDLNGDTALAMGSYDFTCATTGDVSTVEYTFGYKRCADGKPRIYLHHSSVPYTAMPKPITEQEVLDCQAGWVNAIQTISKEYLDGGDFVGAAGTAAGELYGYGFHDVLFKPTKATKNPFRPTGESAMSYFVGADNFEGSEKFKGEDGGFAINGGKGWKKVVFSNHKIDLNGGEALAMGSYDFTCATTGDVSTVEYTFGYKRCSDGKPRIYLHHSSVPYSA